MAPIRTMCSVSSVALTPTRSGIRVMSIRSETCASRTFRLGNRVWAAGQIARLHCRLMTGGGLGQGVRGR